MAQFNATISERLNIFGLSPSDKWAEYNWGSFKWGEGTNQIPTGILAAVAVSAAVTHGVGLGVGLAVAETETLSSDAPASPVIPISETQGSSSGLDDINVLDAAGYYYVFPDRTTDGEQAETITWASATAASPVWVASGVSQASWS